MKKSNKKGFIHHWMMHHMIVGSIITKSAIVPGAIAFKIGFAAIACACIWHIPAWSAAKAKGGDAPAIYQAQEMWPQQVFDKLPGAHRATEITFQKGNGGNFINGIQVGD